MGQIFKPKLYEAKLCRETGVGVRSFRSLMGIYFRSRHISVVRAYVVHFYVLASRLVGPIVVVLDRCVAGRGVSSGVDSNQLNL